MKKELSTSILRLKYKSRFISIKLTYDDVRLIHIDVEAAINQTEKNDFKKIATVITDLTSKGVINKYNIIGRLDHLVGVDYNVLAFMKNFVRNKLQLTK